MSERLELTGEQAKALREWWRYQRCQVSFPHHRELVDALRPLFEPWRVNPKYPHELIGPGGFSVSVVRAYTPGMKDAPALAVRIRDLLNAAERGEPS